MRILRILLGIAAAAVMLASRPVAFGNQTRPASDKYSAEKVIAGQLLNVDTRAKLISLRGPDQKETILNYNDDTQVISPDKSIQGLTAKLGSQIRTSYREERGVKLAIRIELIEKQ